MMILAKQSWNVSCPPTTQTKHVMGGKEWTVPTVRGHLPMVVYRKKRLVLEVMTNNQVVEGASSSHFHDLDTVLSSLSPDDDFDVTVVVRLLKPRRFWGLTKDEESSSSEEDDDDEDKDKEKEEEKGWMEYRCYALEDIDVEDEVVAKCDYTATFGLKRKRFQNHNRKETRQIRFASEKDCQSFYRALTFLRNHYYNTKKKKKMDPQEDYSKQTMDHSPPDSKLQPQPTKPQPTKPTTTTTTPTTTATAVAPIATITAEAAATTTTSTQVATIQKQNNKKEQPPPPPTPSSQGVEEVVKKADDDQKEQVVIGPVMSLPSQEEDHEEEDVQLLVEIVSATDLPIADVFASSDPYVKVYWNDNPKQHQYHHHVLHQTKILPKTLNPIWTVDTGSLFILRMTHDEFFAKHDNTTPNSTAVVSTSYQHDHDPHKNDNNDNNTIGMTFKVKDYDTLGHHDLLGTLHLSPDEIIQNATGERIEYDLITPTTTTQHNPTDDHHDEEQPLEITTSKSHSTAATTGRYYQAPSKLMLRIRPATMEDVSFLKTLQGIMKKPKQRLGVYAEAAFVGPLPHRVNRLRRETKKQLSLGKSTKHAKLHRVKPGPDPDRDDPEETRWMTAADMRTACYKPSTRWIETGSGTLGRVYLEILKCDGLPNKDRVAKANLGDLTDAFCCIIYEDAIVNTDVINDELSPLWMPWTQRAFVFHISNMSSQILLGVFDYDSGSLHDHIGRIAIDVTNLATDMEYVLTYQLYDSVVHSNRRQYGTITVRVRLVMTDIRRAILQSSQVPAIIQSFQLPPTQYVNVARRSDFHAARFVTQGDENPYKLDTDVLASYKEELFEYQFLLHDIQEAAMTVILWRGQCEVKWCCRRRLPLYSVVVFIMGVLLVEDANLFPSFLLFSISLIFLATNQQRQAHPSPWYQTHTFASLWYAIITGKNNYFRGGRGVDEGSELQPLVEKYETERMERVEKVKSGQESAKMHTSMMDAYFYEEEQEAMEHEKDDAEIETKSGGMSLNPLRPLLLPLQQRLGMICQYLRVVRSLVTWDESLGAFFITNACILGGILTLFVPWGWIIRWVLRIAVWTLLGPWMKLVDIFFFQKLEDDGDNYAKRMESDIEQRSKLLQLRKRVVMMRRETAIKLRAMKRYMFGKYMVQVPRFKQYRYRDVPLPQSTVKKYEAAAVATTSAAVTRKHGQQLVGTMIPKWGDEEDRAMLMEIKEKKRRLDRLNPFKNRDASKTKKTFGSMFVWNTKNTQA